MLALLPRTVHVSAVLASCILDCTLQYVWLFPNTQATPTVELLQWIAGTVGQRPEGDDVFAQWYDAQGNVSETHTFEGMWSEAGRIAHDLRVTWGLSKGDRVVLCYGFGLDFFTAFLGCLRAGVLAVPVCECISFCTKHEKSARQQHYECVARTFFALLLSSSPGALSFFSFI